MHRSRFFAFTACGTVFFVLNVFRLAMGQENGIEAEFGPREDNEAEAPYHTPADFPCPTALFDQRPTLTPAAPRVSTTQHVPPAADPREILFSPYFFPTHANFRPLPYGYPPQSMGFYYHSYANPYYSQYYGPGEYWGF